jgi:hypothetical protein
VRASIGARAAFSIDRDPYRASTSRASRRRSAISSTSTAVSFGGRRSRVADQHAGGEDGDALATDRRFADQEGLAEDEERGDLEAAHLVEELALGVGLVEHLRVDMVEMDRARVALGLDREGAAWTDEDVVDVTAAQPDPVQHVVLGREALEDRADLALALRATRRPFGHLLRVLTRLTTRL